MDNSNDSSNNKPTFSEKYGAIVLAASLLGFIVLLVAMEMILWK